MKKILIVDDQDEIRELVRVTLHIDEYQILEAASADEALRIINEQQPDLILLDIMLPNSSMDGFELCQRIKEDDLTRQSTVVMLTARGTQSDMEKGFKAGADDYFTKPFSPLQLLVKVEQVLQN
jgi:two-component system, OmpR family, phosphate regulon response regulator PhoB